MPHQAAVDLSLHAIEVYYRYRRVYGGEFKWWAWSSPYLDAYFWGQ